MTQEINFKVGPTRIAPTAVIASVDPKLVTDCSKCEGNIHVGIFFDGTNNNRDADRPKLRHTNVVRLYDAYIDQPGKGYFRTYIPGVGTAFPEIGEAGESSLGNGFGIGCEQRVLYGLLAVFNAIHAAAFENREFLTDRQVRALSCNNSVPDSRHNPDSVILAKLGLFQGLMIPASDNGGARVSILKDLAQRLGTLLVKGRPVIKECFVDVVGFSRGAAQARVFCSWLDEILTDGKLAGVDVHFRFLGLMDTVASAGFVSSVRAGITGADGGHSGWAEARYLRIRASMRNCVHMIAAHELRRNFPVDTVTVDGKLPPHCQEFVYPGAHSDVGGGYGPGDLGIAFGRDHQKSDACKLAQVPLNHMFDCAVAAGVPLNKVFAQDIAHKYDPYAISPAARKAYDNFIICSTLTPRRLSEWLQPYLNWRWQVSQSYRNLTHVRHAHEADRALLIEYNERLIADADYLANPPKSPSVLTMLFSATKAIYQQFQVAKKVFFEDEAATVLAIAKAAPPVDQRLCELFDYYVHDSLAGFNHNNLELSGYWRHRRGFLGSEKTLIVENETKSDPNRAMA